MRLDANLTIATLVCGVVFVMHSLSPIATSSDSFWTVPVLVSIFSEGNMNLDEYPQLLRAKSYQGVDCVTADYRVILPDRYNGCPPESHYYNRYPIGVIAVALAPAILMDACLRLTGPVVEKLSGSHLTPAELAFVRRNYLECHALVEIVLASAIVAAATAFVFLAARIYLSATMSIALALLFAFGTSAWSTASRAMWQHGPAMLLLAAALWLLALASQRPELLRWTAVPLVIGYFTRPTAGITLALIGAFVFFHHRPQFAKWLLAAAAATAPFLAYNLFIYHHPLQAYFVHRLFLPPTPGNLGTIFSALAAQCLSPSRGLFVFSPFLLFSLAGIYLAFRGKWMTPLVYYLGGVLALHWITISAFVYWTAGHCYGPRYFTDVLPIFMFFQIPAFLRLRLNEPLRLPAVAFYFCSVLSVLIHYRGAADFAVYEWNGIPSEVSVMRVWDWRDPQFLRGICGKIRK